MSKLTISSTFNIAARPSGEFSSTGRTRLKQLPRSPRQVQWRLGGTIDYGDDGGGVDGKKHQGTSGGEGGTKEGGEAGGGTKGTKGEGSGEPEEEPKEEEHQKAPRECAKQQTAQQAAAQQDQTTTQRQTRKGGDGVTMI